MILHLLIYILVRPWLWLFPAMGFPFCMRAGRAAGWFLEYVIGYRKQVILNNLRSCFPEFSEKKIRELASDYYKHLGRLLGEMLAVPAMSREKMLSICRFEENDLLEQYFSQRRSVLVVMGHAGNWEWSGLSAAAREFHEIYAVYKIQKNPYIDQYLRKIRARFGTKLVSMEAAPRAVLASRGVFPRCFTFIADQSADPLKGNWVRFFGRDTVFHGGWAKLACKSGMPVLFAAVVRENGGYRVQFDLIHENPSVCKPEALVQLFAEKLEKQIRTDIPIWLWSHRRWKHRRTSETGQHFGQISDM